MLKTQYPNDLSDEQWELIRRFTPKQTYRGHRLVDRGGCFPATIRSGVPSTISIDIGFSLAIRRLFGRHTARRAVALVFLGVLVTR